MDPVLSENLRRNEMKKIKKIIKWVMIIFISGFVLSAAIAGVIEGIHNPTPLPQIAEKPAPTAQPIKETSNKPREPSKTQPSSPTVQPAKELTDLEMVTIYIQAYSMDNYGVAQKMRDLLPLYFSPVPTIYHYLHIARNKYAEIMATEQVKIKKYFYILRPILACMWIENNQTMPPMEFSKLMGSQPLDDILIAEINKLLVKKTTGLEIDIEPKSPTILHFLKGKIEHYEQYLKTVRKENVPNFDSLNALFRETLMEVWGNSK